MDYANTIYLADPEEVPEMLFGCVEGFPARLAVAMYNPEQRSQIWMPGSGRLGADIGVCISDCSPVGIGTEVLVRADHGMWIDDFKGSGCQVRMYGVSEPWYESIPAMRSGKFIFPLYDWVLLRRKPLRSSDSIILTLDKWARNEAEIIARGPQAGDQARAEQMVAFTNPEKGLNFKFGEAQDDWLLVRYETLMGVLIR